VNRLANMHLFGCSFFACVLAAAGLIASGRSEGQSPAATVPGSVPAKPLFTDVADQRGVTFRGRAYHTSTKYLMETMGSGVAVFDYDNDGLLDIFFANGAPIPNPAPKGTVPQKASPADWNRMFHQKKDGTFEDVTERAGLKGVGYGMGVAVGDYDNDGFEDLFVTSYGGNHLYHNNGNGTFTDVTVRSGTGGPTTPGETWSTSAMWVDLDNDGRLDLVVLRYVHWDFEDIWCGEHREGYRSYCHPDIFPVIRPLAYHNNGDGTFTEVGGAIGLKPGKGLGLALADFDGDGRVDLAVANDSMLEFLYRNKGDGTFEETGLTAEISVDSDGKTYAGMGIDFQDYDNDGLPDLVITNLANQKYALYRNNGDGSFTYDTYVSGLASMTLLHSGWGIHFFDYDNDGLKDLLITQGHDLDTVQLNFPQLRYKEPMLLARNEGKGKFVDVSREAGPAFQEPWVGRGMAIGDLDNDGRLDAVVSTNDGPAHVLHNETSTPNHWITLLLVGHRSNRDAIGAQVKVTTARGSQFLTVSTAGSYLSASDKRLHFGLGSESTIQRINIRWPSGITQELTNVPADHQLKVDEPADSAKP
jgi:enediyne biosynthesis protein E4